MLSIGQRIGKLTVLENIQMFSSKRFYKCRCDCGTEDIFYESALNNKSACKNCNPKVLVAKNDLTDQIFGELHVDYYLGAGDYKCTCSCGKEVIKRNNDLIKGKTVSCGHIIMNPADRKKPHTDLTGKKFNALTVIEYLTDSKYKCKCDCGNECIRPKFALVSGRTKNCGLCKSVAKPMQQIIPSNWIGRKFGELTVVADDINESVICKCGCGHTKSFKKSQLLKGNLTTCGCVKMTPHIDCSSLIVSREHDLDEKVRAYLLAMKPDLRIEKYTLNNYTSNIYLPDYNVAIDVNNSMWHATANCLQNNLPPYYHQDKFAEYKQHGIRLITLYETDWNLKQDKLKNFFETLIMPNRKIYARKCKIKAITKQEANDFLALWHYQGYSNASDIQYGLFLGDELLSVMTFGKKRFKGSSDLGKFELYRYASKVGVSITGGGSKLIERFERDHNPKQIFSYSDNNLFSGNMYKQIGLTCLGYDSPRYFWLYEGKELRRELCQVRHLKVKYPDLYERAIENNISNKEDYICVHLGMKKVYRVGNTRWEKVYE